MRRLIKIICICVPLAMFAGCDENLDQLIDLITEVSWNPSPDAPEFDGINPSEPAGSPVPEVGELVTLVLSSDSSVAADMEVSLDSSFQGKEHPLVT